jgi:hypothetical protein
MWQINILRLSHPDMLTGTPSETRLTLKGTIQALNDTTASSDICLT